MVEKSFLQE